MNIILHAALNLAPAYIQYFCLVCQGLCLCSLSKAHITTAVADSFIWPMPTSMVGSSNKTRFPYPT